MLVGRRPELDSIEQLSAQARLGHSGVLVLVGEAGIGKTTLLAEAVERSGPMNVLRADGCENETGVAFAGLLQLVRPVLGLLDAVPAPQADALAIALSLREGAVADRFAIGAATLALLARAAEDHPLLLVVDDAHRLDRPSAEALAFATRRLLADPVALLVATRPDTDTPFRQSGFAELELSGLDLRTTRDLCRTASEHLPDDLVDRAWHATAGNPLAIVELVRDTETLAGLSPELPPPAPDTIAAAFDRQLSELDPQARSALLLVAVANGDLGTAAQAATELGIDIAALDRAVDHGLVRARAGRAEFRHPLIRATVYGAATSAERRGAHAAVAHALPPGDSRSWHLSEAVVGPDEEVAAKLDAVAQRAAERSAFDLAATAYERAGLLSTDVRRQTWRLLEGAEHAWLAGQPDRAQLLLDRLRTPDDDAQLRARAIALRGHVEFHTGSLEAALGLYVSAADAAQPTDPATAVTLLADAVDTCCLLADAVTACELADRLDPLVSHPRVLPPGRIRGRQAIGIARVLGGLPGGADIVHAVEQLDDLPEWPDDLHRPGWMLMGPLFLRDASLGREVAARMADRLRSRGSVSTLPSAVTYAARHDATTSRWEAALAGYREALDLARDTGQGNDEAMAAAGMAWLLGRMGRDDDARDLADRAIRMAEERHLHLARVWATFARGESHLAHDAVQQAADVFGDLRDFLLRIGLLDVDLFPGPELVDALCRTGRSTAARTGRPGLDAQAHEVAGAYAQRAREKGQPWALARAERALALIADVPRPHFERALELHQATADVFERARTELAFGAALRRDRQRSAARPVLRDAMARFDLLGARPWSDQAARELTATGETVRRRSERYLDTLTPQEIQITRLLGAGRTTREAAAALFISAKTVEYHLRHVYTKLGIHSRAELAGVLRSGDLD